MSLANCIVNCPYRKVNILDVWLIQFFIFLFLKLVHCPRLIIFNIELYLFNPCVFRLFKNEIDNFSFNTITSHVYFLVLLSFWRLKRKNFKYTDPRSLKSSKIAVNILDIWIDLTNVVILYKVNVKLIASTQTISFLQIRCRDRGCSFFFRKQKMAN